MNLISDSSFATILRGQPLSRKCLLNFEMFSSKEEKTYHRKRELM